MQFSGYSGEYIVEQGDAETLTIANTELAQVFLSQAALLNDALATGDAIEMHQALRNAHEMMLAHLNGNLKIALAANF